MSYAIRIGTADDLVGIRDFLDVHLRRDYFIPQRQLTDILGQRYHSTLLAIENDEILGIAIMTKAKRTLVNLLVRPCDRNRGIADALLQKLRVERIRVKTNVTDGDPTGYYLSRGYRMSTERTGKKHIKIAVFDLDHPPRWA